MRAGSVSIKTSYFGAVCLSLVTGTFLGAQLLKIVPVSLVELGMALMLSIVGTIFVFDINQTPTDRLLESPPEKPSLPDAIMAFVAGLLTGLIGISLPVLLYYFGSYLSKKALRHLIVLLFIPSALVQVIAFGANGLLTQELLVNSIVVLPALFAGIYVGNLVFYRLSEHRFRQYLGLFLYVVAVKLFCSI